LEHRITINTWLDDESRSAALAKLESLKGHFFTWPQFWNESFVENLMNDVRKKIIIEYIY
jgi:predicted metalloendopeptidase